MTGQTRTTARRGRLPIEDVPERRNAVLDAAMVELTNRGYDRVTMLSIARRAGASKETLYAWFGNKDGLFASVIQRNADEAMERVTKAMAPGRPPEEVLLLFATGLQRLLLGEHSIAINRMAMQSPELRGILLESGRYRTGALMEAWLADRMRDGQLRQTDPVETFRLLYGLVIEDRQIRVLLGDQPPTDVEIEAHANDAIRRFLYLLDAGRCA